jgi:hypothetical protein
MRKFYFYGKNHSRVLIRQAKSLISRRMNVKSDAFRKQTLYPKGIAMNRKIKSAIAISLACTSTLAGAPGLHAEDGPTVTTLKPVSGLGASGPHKFLLNMVVGKKQAVSYFLNENGVCKVTILVADAFNGVEVPDSKAVRLEVAIGAGGSARMHTAEGQSLEFACQGHAQELIVRSSSLPAAHPSGI